MTQSPAPAKPPAATPYTLSCSRQLPAWLAEQRLAFAVSTYQAGKLFLVGRLPDGRLSVFDRSFARCMGLAVAGGSIWMSTLYQLWRLDNILGPGERWSGADRLYVPRQAWTTGDVDTHDVAVTEGGQPLFVNTLYSCLATVSERASFRPVWKPPFISKLAAEDRCHLNGVAVENGRARYVTATSRADVAAGWRDHRRDGGVVIEVPSGEIVASGLSMPHSPRMHQGKLWVLNSGTGEFGAVDPADGRFTAVCFAPGYLRGLAFHGDFALLGLSRPRGDFAGLPLQDRLTARQAVPRCEVQVVDLRSGDAVHWLRFEAGVNELYDVGALPGVVNPAALGFQNDEICRALTMEPMADAPADG